MKTKSKSKGRSLEQVAKASSTPEEVKKEPVTKSTTVDGQVVVELGEHEVDMAAELKALEAEMENLDSTTEPDPEPEVLKKRRKREPVADSVDGKLPKKKRVVTAEDEDVVTASDLADQLGVEPRILRRTLRKLTSSGQIEAKDGRWAWPTGSKDIQFILAAFK